MQFKQSATEKSGDKCDACGDVGVLCVTLIHNGLETLMRCYCAEGKAQSYKLPLWEWNLGKIFMRKRVPVEWFKPQSTPAPNENCPQRIKLLDSMESKVNYWRARVELAELYWKSGGVNREQD